MRTRRLPAAFVVVAVLLAVAQLAQRSSETFAGEFRLPAERLGNVGGAGWHAQENLWLPGIALSVLLAERCAAKPPPDSLHGDLAYLIAIAEQVPLRSACLPTTPVLGGDSTHALAGYPLRVLEQALPGRRFERRYGFGLLSPQAVLAAPALPTEPNPDYLSDRVPRGHRETAEFDILCPRAGVLAIGNRLARLNEPLEIVLTAADSTTPRAPLTRTTASAFYACAAGEALQLRLTAPLIEMIEVLYFGADDTAIADPT